MKRPEDNCQMGPRELFLLKGRRVKVVRGFKGVPIDSKGEITDVTLTGNRFLFHLKLTYERFSFGLSDHNHILIGQKALNKHISII